MAYTFNKVGGVMIKLSELQLKEVIVIDSGQRLGHIYDLEIDPDLGEIKAIILLRNKKNTFFGKADELMIYWEQIITIGKDVILVQHVHDVLSIDQEE